MIFLLYLISFINFWHQQKESSAAAISLDLISVISEIRSSWSYYLHKEQIRFFIQADPEPLFMFTVQDQNFFSYFII